MNTRLAVPTTCGVLFTALLTFTVSAAAQTPPLGLSTLYSFTGSDGANPSAGVVVGSGGVLYGATPSGWGTVFSLTPPTSPGGGWTPTTLYSFTGGSDGGDLCCAGLVIGSGGVLSGTTRAGGIAPGAMGFGTVFSLTPPASPGGAWTEATLHRFTGGADGQMPEAGVVIGSGGVLYGTSWAGATVFSLTPPASPGGAWTEATLYTFTNGDVPNGVVIGKGGVLYGTGQGWGGTDLGIVFSLTPPASPGGAWTETVLHTFTGTPDGANPWAGVVIGKGNVLYGTTQFGGTGGCSVTEPGCGVVFSLTPPTSPGAAWTETVLYSSGVNDARPLASLVIGNGGVLYGTTDDSGTLFSLTPPVSPGGAWTEAKLCDLAADNSGAPVAGVVIGSGGVLYGTTHGGGSSNAGTVFSFSGLLFPLKSAAPMTKASQDRHYTAATALVNTVFDHSMLQGGKYHIYGCDETVVAYDGTTAANYNRHQVLGNKCGSSGYSPGPTLVPIGPAGLVNGTVVLEPGMTYYGGNDTTRLYFDGHPGIDYHAAMQTQVYAAVTGTIHYPDRIVGLSSGSDFHVMAIIPDHAGGSEPPYLIYYLHLYTYVGQTPTPATDPDPLPGCQGTVSLPLAEGWHVQAGCLVALSGNTSPYTKPLPPHLHFEVHEVVPTATVSKTCGAQNATLCVDNAIGTGFNCVPVDPYGWCTLSQCPATSPDPYFSSTGIANMTLWQ